MSNETLRTLAVAGTASLRMYNLLNGRTNIDGIDIDVIFKDIAEGAAHLQREKLTEAADALLQFIGNANHGKYAADAADAYAKVLRTLRHLEAF